MPVESTDGNTVVSEPVERRSTRQLLVETAGRLLATEGAEAVTTRAVALAAGVPAPTIYRLFGDKGGLLDAVVADGFAAYVAHKELEDDLDPVAALRAGWDLHVGFGLANPALFRLLHTALRTADGRGAVQAGTAVLAARVRRVALAGRLAVGESRATSLVHATGTGVVLALIEQPADERDPGLADLAWDSVAAVILTGSAPAVPGPRAAAVTLRAGVAELPGLTGAERALLAEWLDRVAARTAG